MFITRVCVFEFEVAVIVLGHDRGALVSYS